jgi:branched-chain amino acid transport system permease protein
VSLWLLLAVNSITLGGLLFLLSAGFSLIFGLMRIPNLTHGSFFMLGAYLATSLIAHGFGFWPAAIVAGIGVAAFGGIVERLILRRLAGAELAQVLVTLGLSFMVADVCLMVWTGDPIRIDTPAGLRGTTAVMGFGFPIYRLAISAIAIVFAAGLWLLLDRTRLGAMIRAGVDDPAMARVAGIRVSRLFTIVFCLGAWLAGFAGVMGGPILSVYPGLDAEMIDLGVQIANEQGMDELKRVMDAFSPLDRITSSVDSIEVVARTVDRRGFRITEGGPLGRFFPSGDLLRQRSLEQQHSTRW